MTDEIHRHIFVVNPEDNGGESVTVETRFIPNGDPGGLFTNQEITLQSYCNSATIHLVGSPLTPEILRELANELEQARSTAHRKLEEKSKERLSLV